RREPGTTCPEPMQWEHLLEGLGLATMQVRRVIVDAEQRRHVKAVLAKRRAGGGVVADLERIVYVERSPILEILAGEVVTGEREELVGGRGRYWRRRREPGDPGVEGRAVLGHGGRIVAVEDLALRPLGSAVTGGAIRREHRSPGRDIDGLRLIQRTHGRKDPQRLRVERVASALRDAVVIDRGVGRRRGPLGETLARVELVAGEAAASLDATGVVVEVGVAAADGAPVEQALVFHIGELVEHAVQRFGLAWAGPEDPGDSVSQPVGMARSAAAPGVFGHLAAEIARND